MEMPETLKVYKHYMSISPMEIGYELKLTKPMYPRGEHDTYHHSSIVEALKAENEELKVQNETHKKAYWDLLESWSDLRVKYSIAVDELVDIKAKLEKAIKAVEVPCDMVDADLMFCLQEFDNVPYKTVQKIALATAGIIAQRARTTLEEIK